MFTLTAPNTLSYEVRIDDPEVYLKPWTVSMPLDRDESYRKAAPPNPPR